MSFASPSVLLDILCFINFGSLSGIKLVFKLLPKLLIDVWEGAKLFTMYYSVTSSRVFSFSAKNAPKTASLVA